MGVKRENWNGKFFVVARKSNGRIESKVRWTPKVSIDRLKQHFKNNHILDLDVKATSFRGTNFREFVTTKIKPVNRDFQIVLETRHKNKTIIARSDLVKGRRSISKARKEAEERFFARISNELFNEGYDEDIGKQLAKASNLKVTETIVYYKRI